MLLICIESLVAQLQAYAMVSRWPDRGAAGPGREGPRGGFKNAQARDRDDLVPTSGGKAPKAWGMRPSRSFLESILERV
jgi:hypothetical protein